MFQLIKQLSNQKFQICPAPTGNPKCRFPGIPGKPGSAIRSFLFLLFTSYVLLLISCEKQTTPPQPPNPQVTLSAEAGVIESWLSMNVKDRTENLHFEILRNDSLILNGQLTTNDTTLCDTGLLPAHTYTYAAHLLKNGHTAARSASVEITTMDTTSHNFTWQIDTIGTHSSVLHDVAIINESDIWAVGEIHTAETDTFDSLGNWVPPYNAVHWNGIDWELVRIFWQKSGSQSISELRSIFALSGDNIWVADTAPYHWNGQEWISLGTDDGWVFDGYVYKIWGASPNNIYYVGSNGSITHYNGRDWQKLFTGFQPPFQDVWGLTGSPENEPRVIAVASEKFVTSERIIMQLEPEYSLINWPFPDRRIHSVWFANRNRIWICGAGIFRYHHQFWKEFFEVPLIFTNRIRGNGDNDIFVAGDFGIVAHYNGLSWKVYPEVNAALYESLDVRGDLMVAVGSRNGRGYILRMYR